jgi:hypothetical protein
MVNMLINFIIKSLSGRILQFWLIYFLLIPHTFSLSFFSLDFPMLVAFFPAGLHSIRLVKNSFSEGVQ